MDVFRELLCEIERIPAVDVHSHVRAAAPGASELSQIALCYPVSSELESAGVAPASLEADSLNGGPDQARAVFQRIRNTTSYWCLAQILLDLYGAQPPHEQDPADLAGKVKQSAVRPEWANEVLERANVSKVFVTCDWRKPLPKASERFVCVLRVDGLVNEAHVPRTLESLGETTGRSVYEAGDLKKGVDELFSRAKECGAVAAAVSFEPHVEFEPGDRDAADRALSLVLLGQKAGRDDRKSLRSYVLDQVLRNCAEHDMPMQLMVGVKQLRSSDRTLPAYEPATAAICADLFERHSRVKFDVFTSNETICHELAAAARNYPNVTLSGAWWYLAYPAHIRKILRERIEMLPMTKCCALVSDARCVEWVYGRAKLIRHELALTLAELAREEYLSKDAALDVAAHYLAENPKSIYGL